MQRMSYVYIPNPAAVTDVLMDGLYLIKLL